MTEDERQALLGAVAELLRNDLRPALADARLNFRALIGAHLADVVRADLRAADELELAALAAWAPVANQVGLSPLPTADEARRDPEARRRALEALATTLAERLRAGDLPADVFDAVVEAQLAILRRELPLSNPLFDLRPDLP